MNIHYSEPNRFARVKSGLTWTGQLSAQQTWRTGCVTARENTNGPPTVGGHRGGETEIVYPALAWALAQAGGSPGPRHGGRAWNLPPVASGICVAQALLWWSADRMLIVR